MAVEYDHIGAPITPDGPLPPFNSRTLLRIAVFEARRREQAEEIAREEGLRRPSRGRRIKSAEPADEERWQAYHTYDEPPELAFFCPRCAEREFH